MTRSTKTENVRSQDRTYTFAGSPAATCHKAHAGPPPVTIQSPLKKSLEKSHQKSLSQ